MTRRESLKFKKILQDAQDAAVHADLRRRQDIVIEHSADVLEQMSSAGEGELALADLGRHTDMVRQIRAALGRMEAGTFGVCEYCLKPIEPKRLMAVPWSSLCIGCQETADGQDRADLRTGGRSRATAA